MAILAMAVALTPPLFGILVLLTRTERGGKAVVVLGAVLQAAVAIVFSCFSARDLPQGYVAEFPFLDQAMLGAELALAAFIAIIAIVQRRPFSAILAMIQAALALVGAHWTDKIQVHQHFLVDQVGLLLVLIIAVVGGIILVYSVGYMTRYHEEHPNIRDRRRLFSFVMLSFLGAMYALVMANDLRLLLIFWELTTLASFALIGYAGDEASKKSAYLALNLNMIGGLAFALGIVLLAARLGTVELDALASIAKGTGSALLVAPVALIALAGLIKAAQLPFTPWLLGAMVAPTPVSALLHSSTMVKAGVFLLIKMVPAMAGTTIGYLVSFIGIFTFITGAFSAVSVRNSKRILAWSTVSNLGLIVACAGIGTYELVWVALFLLLFHAIAKALLFISVGTISNATGSLDVESMNGLINTMPRLSICLIIGISCMFVAPFGMLVSKWAAMEAFLSLSSLASPIMVAMLAFGSATTVLFWTKWLGIVIRDSGSALPRGSLEKDVSRQEALSEMALSALAIASCLIYPIVSKQVFEPYLLQVYGRAFGLDRNNMTVTILMVGMTVLLPSILIGLSLHGRGQLSTAYMSGRVMTGKPSLGFKGSKGAELKVSTRSYYLESWFGEERLLKIGVFGGILLVLITLGMATL